VSKLKRKLKMKKTDCKLVEKKLIFYIDNELDINELMLVKSHLEVCSDCKSAYNHLIECMGLIADDKLTETNPFFYTRLKEKMDAQSSKKKVLNWLPSKQLIRQSAFYIVLGIFALFSGFYLGSGNSMINESTLITEPDTTDYQVFASSYNFNFNKNIYVVDLVNNEEAGYGKQD
jgi:predicted anti-sigma-YlaC factor YlaD